MATRATVARGFWGRALGLAGRSTLQAGEALCLRPCTGIHTFFMRFPIDVAFLASGGTVLRTFIALRPWRATPILPSAHCALELPAGTLEATGTCEGDVLQLESGLL